MCAASPARHGVRKSVSLSGKFIKAKSNLQQLELQLLATIQQDGSMAMDD